jgi:RNA-binding protein
MSLTSKERKALKAKAHHLKTVVRIGQHGVSKGVIQETDIALQAHELIKVQIQGGDRDERLQDARKLSEKVGAELVHHIGKIYILYRAGDDS